MDQLSAASHAICNAPPAAPSVLTAELPKAAAKKASSSSRSTSPKRVEIQDDTKKREKEAEKAEEKACEQRRRKKVRKINAFIDSPVFGKLARELELNRAKGSETEAVLDATLSRINDRMGMAYKRSFVNNVFNMGTKTLGSLAQSVFMLEHFRDFHPVLMQHHNEFEEELEEIAIEMDSDYVPNPTVRLMLKVGAFAYQFHEARGQVPSAAARSSSSSSSSSSSRSSLTQTYGGEKDEDDEDEDDATLFAPAFGKK